MCAANPDGARRFEDPVALCHPLLGELEVQLPTSALIPFAFVDADHPASVAGYATIREEIGRVGPDAIEVIVRK